MEQSLDKHYILKNRGSIGCSASRAGACINHGNPYEIKWLTSVQFRDRLPRPCQSTKTDFWADIRVLWKQPLWQLKGSGRRDVGSVASRLMRYLKREQVTHVGYSHFLATQWLTHISCLQLHKVHKIWGLAFSFSKTGALIMQAQWWRDVSLSSVRTYQERKQASLFPRETLPYFAVNSNSTDCLLGAIDSTTQVSWF